MNKGLIKPVSLPPAQPYAVSIRTVIVPMVVMTTIVAMSIIVTMVIMPIIIGFLSDPGLLGFKRLNRAGERCSIRAGD